MLLWPRGCFQCLEAVNKGVEVPIDNEEDDLKGKTLKSM